MMTIKRMELTILILVQLNLVDRDRTVKFRLSDTLSVRKNEFSDHFGWFMCQAACESSYFNFSELHQSLNVKVLSEDARRLL